MTAEQLDNIDFFYNKRRKCYFFPEQVSCFGEYKLYYFNYKNVSVLCEVCSEHKQLGIEKYSIEELDDKDIFYLKVSGKL